jgi:putative DNA primase/helicase
MKLVAGLRKKESSIDDVLNLAATLSLTTGRSSVCERGSKNQGLHDLPRLNGAVAVTFLDFCTQYGLIIDGSPITGKWVAVATVDHPRKRNGRYKLLDRVGFVKNWATMDEVAAWFDETSSPADMAAAKTRLAAMREEERRAEWQAILKARLAWASANPLMQPHPYISGKGLSQLGCHELRVIDDQLLVPMRRANGDLISLQRIWPDGTKKFWYGAPPRGTMFVMRRKHGALTAFVEGLATGLAVYQSVPQADVVVCFNAGNMVTVATSLKVVGSAVVAADNDHQTMAKRGFNPGIDKGKEAAQAAGCGVVWPEGIEGSDFADLLREYGPGGHAVVRRLVQGAARFVVPP